MRQLVSDPETHPGKPMWHLTDDAARLTLPNFSASINVLEPWRGVLAPQWQGGPLPACSVLQIEARELIAPNRLPLEVYVRGRDLIATYAPSEGRNVQTQIYWRVQTTGSAVSLELILSAQTHLLDSRPQLSTMSTFPGGAVYRQTEGENGLEELSLGQAKWEFPPPSTATLLLFRPPGASYSYAEMVHPTDFGGASLERRGTDVLRFTSHLFPEHLEKGVIRRSRVRGVFLAREGDLAAASSLYQAFVAEPLPLTT